MRIEIGQQTGRSYCLDLRDGSVNYIRPIMRSVDVMPIPDYNYGYYFAGPGHFTHRDIDCGLYQVFITHNGRGRFIVEGKEHFMGPNTVAFLNLSLPHRYETVGENWEYEWVSAESVPAVMPPGEEESRENPQESAAPPSGGSSGNASGQNGGSSSGNVSGGSSSGAALLAGTAYDDLQKKEHRSQRDYGRP